MSTNNNDEQIKELFEIIKSISKDFDSGKSASKKLTALENQLNKHGEQALASRPGDQFVIFGGFSGEFDETECSEIKLPRIVPKFKLEWGDGPSDQMETHDNEVLYISACNVYQNITFKGLKIKRIFTWLNNVLPNGDPTIQIHTSSGVCYGDIAPCSCVKRDYMLTLQNAVAGNNYIIIEYEMDCIEITNPLPYDFFPINLINS